MTKLVLVLKKIESADKTKYDTFYSHSKSETFINESDINDAFKSIYTTIISNIQKSLGKDLGWIIDSVIDHNITISKYNPLAGSCFIRLPKKLDHPRKGLINIQNIDDNECFKWCLVRYLNPVDRKPARITKADKGFAKNFDFKDIKFPVKIRDSHKIVTKNSIDVSVFGYENKEKHPIHASKTFCEEKHVDLLLIEEKGKRQYVLIKNFDTFMYNHTLHHGKKIFTVIVYKLLLQNKYENCFKINDKQRIIMPKVRD